VVPLLRALLQRAGFNGDNVGAQRLGSMEMGYLPVLRALAPDLGLLAGAGKRVLSVQLSEFLIDNDNANLLRAREH